MGEIYVQCPVTKFIQFKTDKQTEEIRKIKEEEKLKAYEKRKR